MQSTVVLKAAEQLLLDSSENHYLRPSASLVGRYCHASLTTRRLLLYEAEYDLTRACERRVGTPLQDIPLETIERATTGPASDEPSIQFDVRNGRKELERLVLWFRDPEWHRGIPGRVAERDEWIATIAEERGWTEKPLASTRREGIRAEPRGRTTRSEGQLLGGVYTIVRPIGSGGMGLVYEGHDRKLDRTVAIKKLRPDLQLEGHEKDLFLDEARTCAALHHPFIVDIYAILEEGSDIYLVFEYVDGQTLQDVIRIRQRMAARDLMKPLEHVCAALTYAHAQRVVHRDLKPSNIMLTSQGYAKVMDFGIARRLKDTVPRTSVGTSDVSGTFPYMAPEQEMGTSDRRADVFALGVTLYEALTGELPFPGPNYYLQKEKSAHIPVQKAAPETPAALAAAVERCLRFDKTERFQSVEELASAVGLH